MNIFPFDIYTYNVIFRVMIKILAIFEKLEYYRKISFIHINM